MSDTSHTKVGSRDERRSIGELVSRGEMTALHPPKGLRAITYGSRMPAARCLARKDTVFGGGKGSDSPLTLEVQEPCCVLRRVIAAVMNIRSLRIS